MSFAGLFGSLTKPSSVSSRKPCEDSSALVCINKVAYAGIFDGVGGLPNGNLASSLASRCFSKLAFVKPHDPSSPGAFGLLLDIFHFIHEKIKDEKQHCCTTAAAVHLGVSPNGERLIGHALSVGDSRLYVFSPRNSELIKVTEDSVDWEDATDILKIIDDASSKKELKQLAQDYYQAQYGNLEPSAAEFSEAEFTAYVNVCFKQRNTVDSVLGYQFDIHPTLIRVETPIDSWFVLTTDGVHDNLTTSEIKQILIGAKDNPIKANSDLLEAAQSRSLDKSHFRSKPDDITAGIIFYQST